MKNISPRSAKLCLRPPAIRQICCALAIALIGWTAGPTRAIDVTWTGTVNNNWSNDGNWNVGEPFSGDSVVFPNTGQTNVRADFSVYDQETAPPGDQPALHLESVTFAPAAPAYAIELYASAETSLFYQANLAYDGAGLTNSSGMMQNFVIDRGSLQAKANGEYTGVDGGRLTFNNSASAGSNVAYHALGGVSSSFTAPTTNFYVRTSGGAMFFNNSASAGSATFIADGGAGNGGLPAHVEFHNTSTAANGTFTSNGGTLGGNGPGEFPPSICGFGGETVFFDTANAGTAHFTSNGTSGLGGSGGLTSFTQNSSAANGVFVTNPATDSQVGSGIVQFLDSSTAANGNFSNYSGPLSTSNGRTEFWDTTTAANAAIDNLSLSGASNYGGTTDFHDHATAAGAVINNRGLFAGGMGGQPAITSFHDDSTADAATIHNWSGSDYGGRTLFFDHSSAGTANIILEPGGTSDSGGWIVFNNNSSAGSAHLSANANTTVGLIAFYNQSTAANAVIALGSNNGNALNVIFHDDSSAGSAVINVGLFSYLQFYDNSTAGNANISIGSDSRLVFGGSFEGPPTTTAGHATIHLLGGASVSDTGASARFVNSSTAANATITVEGAGVADAGGASLVFDTSADAGSSSILLRSSPVSDSPGGALYFRGGASGPLARVTTEAGSFVNVVGNAEVNGFSGTSLGSLEGAGSVILGAAKLTVGALGLTTTFSGPITGTDGRLTKVGPGQLTLAGTNNYTGQTTVHEGILAMNGTMNGPAVVESGATLKGTGNFLSTVTVLPGGMFAPGNSPGTITVAGLALMSGSTLQYELGAGDIRDRIVVTNNGTVVLGGLLDLSILPGFDPAIGQTFSLFEGSLGSITGTFSAVNSPIFNGHALNLVYGTNQVMLQVGLAGDFNGDGTVNAADYVVWRKGLGTTYTQTDYDAWRAHFGQTAGSGAGNNGFSSVAIPEPATLTLFVLGFVIARFGAHGRSIIYAQSTFRVHLLHPILEK